MALTETVQLDITQAQRQIDQLDQQLATLGQPIDVPVSISGERQLAQIRQDLGLSENAVERLNRELDQTDDSLRQVGRAADNTGDDLDRAGRRGRSAFDGLGTSILGFATALGAIQGARAFLDFAADAIDAASNLEESTSKAQVVFGEFFDDIEAFAGTAPQALGLANAQALEFTATFGNLFTALGLSQQAAADLSPEIVQLGADLASFNNLDVEDALEKLRSGLVGEIEPLRALGVSFNAAQVEAKALELGLGGVTGELSEAAKVQARYALILEQTTNAQGDFARTSDSIANRQRTLAGEFENLRASVGEALLPAFEQLLEIAPALIEALENGLVPAIASVATAIGSVDTEGFTRAIAGLPGAANEVAQQTGNAFGILANTVQGAFDLATFNVDAAIRNFREAGESIDELGIDRQVSQSIQDLLTTIQLGRQPVQAFADVLATLAGTAIPDDLLGGFAEQLAAIAGVDTDDAAAVFRLINELEDIGPGLGFSADQLDILRAALLNIARGGVDPADIALQRFRTQVEEAGDEAADAAPKVDAFAASLFAAGQQEFALQLDDEIARLERQFERLPTALDGVQGALRTEEGEIVSDFGTFADNLIAELQAQLDFVSNLDLLREMGFDDLADRFAELGPEYAGLLADGLADPSALSRAEDAIDAYERTIDEGIRQTTVDSVTAAIGSINDLGTALESLEDVQITASVFLELTGPGAEFAGSFGTGSFRTSDLQGGSVPNVSGQGGNVIVNQTFTSPQTPTTEAARASQSVSALIAGPE